MNSAVKSIFFMPLCLSLVLAAGCKPSIPSGWIEYDHNLTNSYGGFEQTVRVTGTVGFLSSDAALTPQNSMYSGSGTAAVAISGTAEDCTISGSGSNDVSLKGSEFLGKIYFKTTETWYNPASFTVSCPEGEPMEVPLPTVTIDQKISFPLEDGAVFEQPYIGAAGSGTYRWILHIGDM
jgi:hypothetical protein